MTRGAVVACTWGGSEAERARGVEDLLTLARGLASAWKTEARWLVLGPLPADAAETGGAYGVGAIDHAGGTPFARFRADPFVEGVARYCAEREPRAVLLPQNPDTRLAAPRLAGRLGSGVLMNVVAAELDEDEGLRATASAFGGDTRAVYRFSGAAPHVLALMPNAVTPDPVESASPAPVRTLDGDPENVEERIRIVREARSEGPRLEDAQIIVAGGRGLGSAENYALVERLADAIGGLAAASRPIVDDGWAVASRQVGLTGRITRPALYIAAGISGASQHMAGCSAAKTLVAINRDPDAAIFRYARYGIVDDCLEILPELIRAVKAPGS